MELKSILITAGILALGIIIWIALTGTMKKLIISFVVIGLLFFVLFKWLQKEFPDSLGG